MIRIRIVVEPREPSGDTTPEEFLKELETIENEDDDRGRGTDENSCSSKVGQESEAV